ncbi:MAG: class I SAM-dependent methyltransferase [Myxococcota bacterium]
MSWNNPLPLTRLMAAMEPFGWGERVLDIGCGSGELLGVLSEQGVAGVGVDRDARAIEAADARGHRGVEWLVGDATTTTPDERFDRVVLLGATQAFGRGPDALPAALTFVRSRLATEGLVVVGELFGRGPPPEPWRAFLGDPTGLERTHADNVAACEASGYRCVHAVTASEADWDAFEWAHFRSQGRTEWRDAWLRWGRDHMGFGVYVLGHRSGAPTISLPADR